jgi:hypothetical protein
MFAFFSKILTLNDLQAVLRMIKTALDAKMKLFYPKLRGLKIEPVIDCPSRFAFIGPGDIISDPYWIPPV